MRAWVEYMLRQAVDDLILDSGFHYGDWLAFHSTRADYPGATTDKDLIDRKSTRLNSIHPSISYAVFCLKKKKQTIIPLTLLIHINRMVHILDLYFSGINVDLS